MTALYCKMLSSIKCRLSTSYVLFHLQNRSASILAGSFKHDDLTVTLTTSPLPKPDPTKLLFGHTFTDHMLRIEWTGQDGWGKPVICPLEHLRLHPAAKVLHYAPELFEGMKAFRGIDGKVRLFRPLENMDRMLWSAERACLPTFDRLELSKCLKHLVSVDQDWVPQSTEDIPYSLYIRPTLIGTEPTLGVSSSNRALLFVILGPVGPYFPSGMKPVSLLANPKFVRAWPGGCGFAKMGSNYAPTIAIQKYAEKEKCQQVLWLSGDDEQLTEVGCMNLFMLWTNEKGEDELITAPLTDGLVLPGITRKSLIELTKQWGEFKVSEEVYTMSRVVAALKDGRVKEMFGSGTACVVCPVEAIMYQGSRLPIPTMEQREPVFMRLYKQLTDIQYGRVKHEWAETID